MKLDNEPRLAGASSPLLEWARKVALVANSNVDAIALKAPINSPALTGAPTAPNPTAGTRGTRIATMQMFADEFTALKAATGWQKLPSGVIVQWGSLSVTAAGDGIATFPVAFPTACMSVQLTVAVGSTSGPYFGCIANINASAFAAGAFSSGTRIAAGMLWLAVGY